MRFFRNISNGYKRIAAGIAIVGFLSMMYLSIIPGASIAYIYGPNGGVLSGAFVFIKEWPQYNDTTDIDGIYSIDNMPYGDYTLVAAGNDSYAPNITSINVSQGTVGQDITLSPAIKYFSPFLYQRTDNVGFDYDSALQIQNNGTENNSVEITFYNPADGTKAGNDFISIKPNELLIKHPFELLTPRTIYYGPMFVKSDKPVQVQGYIKTISQDVYSIGPSFNLASTSFYVPFLYQRQDHVGFDYDSGIQVFNPGDVPTDVTIKLYDPTTGNLVANRTYTGVGPKADILPKILDIYPGITMWYGPAEVTSTQPVVVQGYIRTSATNIYSIAPALDSLVKNASIPFLYQRTDGAGFDYDSGLQVFNAGEVPTDVNIKLYDPVTGNIVANNTYYNVGPKTEILPKIVNMYPTVPSIWYGPAEVTSTQPVAVQGYIRTTASKVYSVAPQVRKPSTPIDVHIPFLYSPKNGSHDAGLQVFNANNIQANINIKFYYNNGTLAGNRDQLIGPMQEYLPKVFDIAPNTQDFIGYGIITTDQPVVAQGFIRTKGSANIYSIAPPVER